MVRITAKQRINDNGREIYGTCYGTGVENGIRRTAFV